MPRRAVKSRPIAQDAGPRAMTHFCTWPCRSSSRPLLDLYFFQTEDYEFWLGYVQVCLPGELPGKPMPRLR